jgi:hypothetical protein
VDPVPDPLLLRKSGSAGNQTWTSGSVARNCDHYTIEAVPFDLSPSRNYSLIGSVRKNKMQIMLDSIQCRQYKNELDTLLFLNERV